MLTILHLLGMYVANLFKSRRRLEAENLFLRHQLNIALRRRPLRLRLRGSDRALLACMTRMWPSLLGLARVVEPATILRWHRARFRTCWCWKSSAVGCRVTANHSFGISTATNLHEICCQGAWSGFCSIAIWRRGAQERRGAGRRPPYGKIKGRDVRGGRRAEEVRNISVFRRCAFLARDVRFSASRCKITDSRTSHAGDIAPVAAQGENPAAA
jgi:hypothetical protein